MKAVFNKEFTLDSYEELQLCLKEEFLILPKVFASFVNLPNIHINMHLLMHAKTFGTLVNFQVGIKEMVHPDGGIDPRLNRSCSGFTSSNFDQLFSNWYVTEDKYLIEEQIQNDDVKVTSPVNFISNISLKKRMSKQEHDKLLLTLHNFKIELFLSYVDMKFEAALINSSISWYKLASYTIEEKNATGDKWRRIFPITVIDNVQKVHFIHNCNSERCQLPNHDTTNRIWIKNNFYFTAI
ncbi:hypothetical protein GLOIN_2v1848961 [Rhizophagus irregularis DAOM 181602=DAOM 197198]|nr:hypothetical protein GLOIN_2v1848961 [Rhizophagus irregularis DAOM 181602=DAOM 197198]